MGVGGSRISVSITISGQSQSAIVPLTLDRVNQIIATASVLGQTATLELLNENSDILHGPIDIAFPENRIRPDLVPKGVLTARITNPTTQSGTVTLVFITEVR